MDTAVNRHGRRDERPTYSVGVRYPLPSPPMDLALWLPVLMVGAAGAAGAAW